MPRPLLSSLPFSLPSSQQTTASHEDMKEKCQEESVGKGRVQECLREHANSLSTTCASKLFKVMEETAKDASVDWPLIFACKTAASEYCQRELVSKTEGMLLKCLIHHKAKDGINVACKKAIRIRHMEQFTDARLNPVLLHHCQNEISSHCMEYHENKDKISSFLMKCLREVFREQAEPDVAKKGKLKDMRRKMSNRCYRGFGKKRVNLF